MFEYHIAIITPEYTPFQGSECCLGWNLPITLAKENPNILYTVLAATGSWNDNNKYQEHFECYMEKSKLPPNMSVKFISYGPFAKTLSKINGLLSKSSPIGNALIFFRMNAIWYKRALAYVKRRDFDLVHLLTPISYKKNSMAFRTSIPTLVGPTGGLTKLNEYRLGLPLKSQVIEGIRNSIINFDNIIGNHLRYKHNHNYIIFDSNEKEFYKNYKPIILPDSACQEHEIKAEKKYNKKIKIMIVGQLTVRKQPFLMLEALKENEQLRDICDVQIIGDGPLRADMLQYITEHRLEESVRMIGKIRRSDLDHQYSQSDLLVHMSYREAATHVIPEAISHGLGIVAHNVGGIREFVCEKNGYLITLKNIENSKFELTETLLSYHETNEVKEKWRKNSYKKSEILTYKNMARLISIEHERLIRNE